MKLRKRKGFTLVELLVVIAILAVLATVAILGYSSFTKKATISNDTAIVNQMNLALQASESLGEAIKTVQDAVEIVRDAGFVYGNLTPTTTDYDIMYDIASKRFYLYGDGKVIYKDNATASNVHDNADKTFKVIHAAEEENNTSESSPLDKSAYLYVDYDNGETLHESWSNAIYTSKGIDVGNVEGIKEIHYINSSSEAQEVVIRTNGGSLTVNAKVGTNEATSDKVAHYGMVDSVNVVTNAKFCYDEFGRVGLMQVAQGTVVLNSGSVISRMHFTKATETSYGPDDNKIKVEYASDVVLPTFSRDAIGTNFTNDILVVELKDASDTSDFIWLHQQGVYEQILVSSSVDGNKTAASSGDTETQKAAHEIANNLTGEYSTIKNNDGSVSTDAVTEAGLTEEEVAEIVETSTVFAEGKGTEEEPWLITCRADMEKLKSMSDIYYYYKVKNSDVNIDFTSWKPGKLHGSFDGNGATFNLNNSLFTSMNVDSGSGYVKNLIVNVNISSSSAVSVFGSPFGDYYWTAGYADCICNSGDFIFENVKVNGSITGAGAAPYSSYVYVKNLTFINCESNAIVTTTNNATGSAGFVIHTCSAENVYLINSKFTGSLYHTNSRTGYWTDMSVKSAWYVDAVSDCENGLYTINRTYGNKGEVISKTNETINGVQFTKYAILPEYKSTSGMTCWYTYVKAVKMYQGVTATNVSSTEMYTGNHLTIAKTAGANSCKVTLFVSPNNIDGNGGFYGAYEAEDALSVNDGANWSSDKLNNLIIKVNGSATSETGFSSDGKTYNIVSSYFGHTYGTAVVQFVEYNSAGQILSITNYTISAVNE